MPSNLKMPKSVFAKNFENLNMGAFWILSYFVALFKTHKNVQVKFFNLKGIEFIQTKNAIIEKNRLGPPCEIEKFEKNFFAANDVKR